MFYATRLKNIRWTSRRSKGFTAFVYTQSMACKSTQVGRLTDAEKSAVAALFGQLGISEWTVGERTAVTIPASRRWIRIGHTFRISSNAFRCCRQAVFRVLPVPADLARHIFTFAYPKQVLLG